MRRRRWRSVPKSIKEEILGGEIRMKEEGRRENGEGRRIQALKRKARSKKTTEG